MIRPLSSGVGLCRLVAAQIASKDGDALRAIEFAKHRGWQATMETLQKAIVSPGTTTDDAPLVPTDVGRQFQEAMRGGSFLDRAGGFRPVPFNVPIPRIATGAHASFVAQATPAPVTSQVFATIPALPPKKVIGDVVISTELADLSTPSAVRLMEFDLGGAINHAMDVAFLDPLNAGSDSTPASVAYGAPVIPSTGNTATQVANDIANALASMASYGSLLTAPYIALNPVLCARLALKRTTTGAPAFPDLTARGGSIAGIPAITTAALPIQSGDVSDMVIIDASLIALADDGVMDVKVARHASIQLSTTPDSPTGASTVLTSLWQMNLAAVRVIRFCNWQRTVDGAACAAISGVPS